MITASWPYRALIGFFPRQFRHEYADQMESLFRQMLADRAGDRRAIVLLWLRAIGDILRHAGTERFAQLAHLAKSGGKRPPRRVIRTSVAADLRAAVRNLVRAPGFAFAFILTLGLGIGANAAIFSVINGVLLRPLPHDGGDAIVFLEQPAILAGVENATFSMPEILDYRRDASSLAGIADYSDMTFTLLGHEEPRRVRAAVISGSFFSVMGLHPWLGRTLDGGDDGPDANPVAVLTHPFWTRQFAADSNVIGQTVTMNGRTLTIVGILEPIPQFPSERDVFVNNVASPHHLGATMNHDRRHRMTHIFARLAPGVSLDAARREIEEIDARMHERYPDAYPEEQGYGVTVSNLRERLTRNAKATLLILLGTAGFVLMIACANVANLTLTRIVRREKELAVRSALGASRHRLRSQLLLESLALSLAGATLGIGIAVLGLDLLKDFAGRYTTRAAEIGIDGTVLAFAAAVAVGAAVLFAWSPRLPGSRDLSASLTEAGGRTTESAARRRLQRGLVIAQLAVSFVLLTGAGLLVRTLINLQNVDPGFDPQNVLTVSVPFGSGSMEERREFYRTVLQRVGNRPGVRSAAVAMTVPLAGSPMTHNLTIEGREIVPGTALPTAAFRSVSSGYFRTVGMPLVRGRLFDRRDHADAPPVAIINQSMAAYYFPNEDPIGRRISFDMGGTEWRTVIGVVADTKDYGLDREVTHTVFQPFDQVPWAATVLVRTAGNPRAIAAGVVGIIRVLRPDQPVEGVRTLEEIRSDAIAPRRLNATLFGAFAVLALVIAAVGVSGVLAFSVSQRTHEFGIRLTLGADRRRVLRMVLGEGFALAAAGLVIGGAGAFALSRFLSGLLFGIEPTDPATFGTVAVTLVAVALTASLMPANRATRVDPLDALRTE